MTDAAKAPQPPRTWGRRRKCHDRRHGGASTPTHVGTTLEIRHDSNGIYLLRGRFAFTANLDALTGTIHTPPAPQDPRQDDQVPSIRAAAPSAPARQPPHIRPPGGASPPRAHGHQAPQQAQSAGAPGQDRTQQPGRPSSIQSRPSSPHAQLWIARPWHAVPPPAPGSPRS